MLAGTSGRGLLISNGVLLPLGMGGGSETNGPAFVPVVLYAVAETGTCSALDDVGAYCIYSSVDGVRATTVVVITVFDTARLPVVAPRL